MAIDRLGHVQPTAAGAALAALWQRRWTVLVLVLVVATAGFLLWAPTFLNLYWMRLLSFAFLYAVLAQGINLIAGYTGYPAFGNVVFFGIGAYAVAITMVKHGGGFWTGMVFAVVVPLAVAALLGPPLLRLKGHYFAIATVGLNEVVKAFTNNLRDFTGGAMGLSLPFMSGGPAVTAHFFYYLLFALMALSLVVTWWFSVSRLGQACTAIRDDEEKAAAMGIRTARLKTVAWMISAALSGAAGGIYAYWMSYIEPATAFNMLIAVKAFVIFLLGGAGTVLGPIVAAFFFEFVSAWAWSYLLAYHVGLMGLIIIAVVIFMPNGFGAFLRERLAPLGLDKRRGR